MCILDIRVREICKDRNEIMNKIMYSLEELLYF